MQLNNNIGGQEPIREYDIPRIEENVLPLQKK